MKVFFTVLFSTYVAIAFCQGGRLDSTFGNSGLIKTMIGDHADFLDLANAAALQSDGKILVSGGFLYARPELMRYLSDGKVDSSFGENGIASVKAFPLTTDDNHIIYMSTATASICAIAIQSDGKILITGNADGIHGIFVARFMYDGKLDTTFGYKGFAAQRDYLGKYGVSALVLQRDGKLIIAGGKSDMGISDGDFPYLGGIVIRFNTDGTVDKSFAKDGVVVNENSWQDEYVGAYENNAIALQPDGKIVTTGYEYGGYEGMNHTLNFVINRYNTDGTADSTFGNAGTVITRGGNRDDNPESILVQPDGKILIGGSSVMNHRCAMVALRYTANGKLDSTFGKGGIVKILFNNKIDRSCRALLQPNGKIILTGDVFINAKNEKNFAMCRISENGSIDSSFGIGGKDVIVSPDVSESFRTSMLQPDRKIVLVSYIWYNEKSMAVLARYIPDVE